MSECGRLIRPDFPARVLAILLLGCAIFPAAADDGKPRYVSGAGRDAGDCQNRFRPCRTLSYAIAHAGKGDRVQVAEGTYTIRESKQLFDLLSVAGRISAGFSQYSGYSERNASAATLLIGVPPEFRERFEAAGFTVIIDTKSLGVSREEAQRMHKLTRQITAAERSHAAAPCAGGMSAGFACQSVSLLSHLSLQDLRPASSAGNDVWGFTDLNTLREYAFMGLQNGVAVVDVTDPQAPEQVGSVAGSSTTWRDIKVYQLYDASAARWRAYAYATADAVQDFLIVLDLSALPNGVERVAFNSDFRAAHNAYIVNADYSYGLAQSSEAPLLGIAGAGINGGNYRLYSLANPRVPQLLNVATFGYAHDLASFAEAAARKAQCPAGNGAARCQLLADFNENTVDLWDITNPGAPQRLSTQPYANARYVHSGWWTEDGRYLLVHDELDERDFGLNTTVRVFDVSSLTAPAFAGSWVGPTAAIDHNGYVKGNRYYVSNYSEGLTVLDLSNPTAPARVGFFDTFPASAQTGFVGAWGVYPFFASGTIAVGDINSGLYLLANETLATPRGSFAMASADLSGTEGQPLSISVNRSGGGTGAVSVRLEVLHATADADNAALATTTLDWANGDTQPKTTTLTLADDGQSENLELLLVRLKAPQGGASIGYPDTTIVRVGDAGRATRLGLLDGAPTVDEARGRAFVTVTRRGSAGGEARVSYRIVAGGTYGGVLPPTQGELVWPDGDANGRIITFTLNSATLSAGQSGTFVVELSGAVNASLETADGTSVPTLQATVTIVDPAAPHAPPPPSPPTLPPPQTSDGGGNIEAYVLVMLALLLARARRHPRRSPGLRPRPDIPPVPY